MRRGRWRISEAPGRLEETKNDLEHREGEEDCGRSEGFRNAPDTRRTARPWKTAEARRRRWQTGDFAEVADSGDNREACTRQIKIREGRERGRRCRKRGSRRSLGKRGSPRGAMEGQGRRWQMWKIRRRQERAKAWMAAEDRGVPRGTAERRGGRRVTIKSVSSVQFS